MRHSQLNRAVAHATGETVRTIMRRGFSIVAPRETALDEDEADRRPNVIDWDRIDADRMFSMA